MVRSNVAVTRVVRRWMKEQRLSQARLAELLGIPQTAVSRRLRGVVRWSLDDLDMLVVAGAPVYPVITWEDEQ